MTFTTASCTSYLSTTVFATVVGASVLGAGAALGAETDEAGALAESSRLRDAGQWEAATATLRTHLEVHPPCVRARRLLAPLLYWGRDLGAAHSTYEAALALDPGDPDLRLEYGRMLVETNDTSRARALLEPLTDDPARGADAEALLGILFYWRGDLARAEGHLRRALLRKPEHAEARRRLHEIRALTAPWLRFRSSYVRDDQPLRSADALLEGGFRPRSGTSVRFGLQPRRFWSEAAGPTLLAADASLSQDFPRSRLSAEAAAGVLLQHSAADWTGRLAVQGRPGAGMTLRITAERVPYLATPSSLLEPILTTSLGGSLGFASRSGWLGQAVYAQQSFPDENAVTSAYAWLVAPVLGGSPPRLCLGYAFSWQDARSSRFVPVGDGQPASRPVVPGHYDPYYTPARVRAHQLVATTSLRPGAGLALSASGSWAFSAREDAPLLVSVGDPASADPVGFERFFFPRGFRPWSARGSVSRAFADLTVAVRAEHLVTSQYASTSVELEVSYRFSALPRGGR